MRNSYIEPPILLFPIAEEEEKCLIMRPSDASSAKFANPHVSVSETDTLLEEEEPLTNYTAVRVLAPKTLVIVHVIDEAKNIVVTHEEQDDGEVIWHNLPEELNFRVKNKFTNGF